MYAVIEQRVKIFFLTFCFNSSILFIWRYSRSTLNMDETFLLTSKWVIKEGSWFVWDLRRAQNIYNDDAAKSTMFGLKRSETVFTVNYVLITILKNISIYADCIKLLSSASYAISRIQWNSINIFLVILSILCSRWIVNLISVLSKHVLL